MLKQYQIIWLYTRGGRNEGDVRTDENGFYVLMGDGAGGMKKVYLPE